MLAGWKITGASLLLILTFGAGASAQSAATGSACAATQEGITLTWRKVPAKGLKLPAKYGTATLPRQYSIYTTDDKSLKDYMALAGRRGASATEISLPSLVASGCTRFLVSGSGTLSPELAAKFPGLVSLKGNGIEDAGASVRLDFDGKLMNAEIRQQEAYYIIAPWKKGNRTYYLLYRKEDSTIKRSTPGGR